MRRFKQEVSAEAAREMLARGTSGVLSLVDGQQAYGVPISYVFTEIPLARQPEADSPAPNSTAANEDSGAVDSPVVVPDSNGPEALPSSAGCIYFHCARAGRKLEALRANPNASFCVIAQDEIVPAEYTTYFRSVIAEGRLHEVADPEEARAALRALAEKYAPNNTPSQHTHELTNCERAALILRLDIASLTGKQARELIEK